MQTFSFEFYNIQKPNLISKGNDVWEALKNAGYPAESMINLFVTYKTI